MSSLKLNTKINLQDFSKSISKILSNPSQKIPKYLEFLLNNKKTTEQIESHVIGQTGTQENHKINSKPIITEQSQQFLSSVPATFPFNSPTQKQSQKQYQGIRLSLNSKEKTGMQEKKSEKKIIHQQNKSISNHKIAVNLVEERAASKKGKKKQFLEKLINSRKKNSTTMSLDTANFQSLKKYFQYKENSQKQDKYSILKKDSDTKKHQRNKEEKYQFLDAKPAHKKKQSEDLLNCQKKNQVEQKDGKLLERKKQLTLHDFNSLVKKELSTKDQNLKTLNINLFEKNCISRKAIDLNQSSKASLNTNNANQFFSMTVSSMKQSSKRNQQYTFTKNCNLKLNNFVQLAREQSDLSIKTASNKTTVKPVSQLTDTNSLAGLKKFNFPKESATSSSLKKKDQQAEETTNQATEYEKLQDQLNSLENKILSVKTNIDANNKQLQVQIQPKTTSAIASKALLFSKQKDIKMQNNLSNDKKVIETSQISEKNNLINLFKKINQNIKQEQQPRISIRSKDLQQIKLQNEKLTQYLNKIKQQQETKKSQVDKQQQKFSKEFPEPLEKITETHHIRNYTAAVDQRAIRQEELPSISSIVTQVKLGQQFGQLPLTAASPQTCLPPTPEQSQPYLTNYSEEFIFGFQELYYVGKLIESFLLDIDDYFVLMFRDHFLQSLQTLHFLKCIDTKVKSSLEDKKVRLGVKDSKKKTLVLDLDETLIHCNESLEFPSDIIIPIQFPTGEKLKVGVNIRPYTHEFLSQLNQYYEIIIFTASHSCYANKVLDYLDPKNTLIKHRLFRENCVLTPDGFFVKDLSIFEDRDINEIILVDNAVYSFAFHLSQDYLNKVYLDNGIPILPFYDNSDDTELQDLTDYLIKLSQFDDITKINSLVFRFNDYHKFLNPVQLLETLYPAFLEDDDQEEEQQQQKLEK